MPSPLLWGLFLCGIEFWSDIYFRWWKDHFIIMALVLLFWRGSSQFCYFSLLFVISIFFDFQQNFLCIYSSWAFESFFEPWPDGFSLGNFPANIFSNIILPHSLFFSSGASIVCFQNLFIVFYLALSYYHHFKIRWWNCPPKLTCPRAWWLVIVIAEIHI